MIKKEFGYCLKTAEFVSNSIYCGNGKPGCARCNKKNMCKTRLKTNARSFEDAREKQLSKVFSCPKKNRLCEWKDCGNYNKCNLSEKKNYGKWRKAYENNDKKLMGEIRKEIFENSRYIIEGKYKNGNDDSGRNQRL